MRVVFVGRLEVVAGLARACEDAGHDVAMACRASAVGAVEMAGFEALPAGLDVDAEPDHATEALAGDLAPLLGHWGARLVVHDDGATAAGAAAGAHRAGRPAAVVAARPVPPSSALPGWPAPHLAARHLAVLPPSFQWTARPERWAPGFAYLRPGPFSARPPDEDVAVGSADWAFVLSALAAGTPVVMAPQDEDQAELAFRVTASGAGVLDGPEAVQQLLDEPLYFANAQRLRREIGAMPSPAEAVAVLEAACR
jgi:UDP:flavonoid glycosyltransferase YjiC (YdhE family)